MDPRLSRTYRRYHIETELAPNIAPYPTRFSVRVGKIGLARHLLHEIIHQRFRMKIVTSRPCMYGTFSGPIGGFAPRPKMCVGCLRCMAEYPDFVRISHNPARTLLGDSYFKPSLVDAVMYEAESGKVPVKGAGYRGRFGGEGWDGMWTDMSEIVRPTRDGIHGREFISTVVHVGDRPPHLMFDEQARPVGPVPHGFFLPLPILFDLPPASLRGDSLTKILVRAAGELETLAVLPISHVKRLGLQGKQIVPLISREDLKLLPTLAEVPLMIELSAPDEQVRNDVARQFSSSILCLRLSFASGFEQRLLRAIDDGIRVFHLFADYHGRNADGDFVLDLIRRAHQALVHAGRRNDVTLIGGGGIVLAEHVPKAIVCGLDVVSLETSLLVALQSAMKGECVDPSSSHWDVPELPFVWGVQRLKNLIASWRDQLLEVMGAMGLREVRRLRGEIGRAMFQKDLEREAFQGISGYDES